jgi:hypothetical protein
MPGKFPAYIVGAPNSEMDLTTGLYRGSLVRSMIVEIERYRSQLARIDRAILLAERSGNVPALRFARADKRNVSTLLMFALERAEREKGARRG